MKNILFFATNNELPFKLIDQHLKQLYDFTLIRDIKNMVQYICKQPTDLCMIENSQDGIRLIQSLKLIDDTIPILLIANIDNKEDKARLFELNCTEYMFQPFLSRELVLRIENALNRIQTTRKLPQQTSVETITIGNSIIDFKNRTFQSPSGNHLLSHKENELLKILCVNKKHLITREQILMQIWKKNDSYSSKSMDVYITRIRKMLKEDELIILQNYYGSGYMLSELNTGHEWRKKQYATLDVD
ncbi:MAG: DNA-binding response regulator [Bacteroidetes bacterium]|nr:MAG: DNA-binding response regulator [Bacteroidota bacterium]